MTEHCAGCGLAVAGGSAGCQAIFDEFLARDFGDVTYFRVHRLLVDTYALQHPDRYCVSAKSLAAHLAGLCSILEHGASRAVGAEWLRGWLDGTPALAKPALPVTRGGPTIADVRAAADPVAHGEAVERWARAVWEAYLPLQAQARAWVTAARSRGPGRPSA
jgi:Family of unknown function (DUF5946)